jgi:hypothetical protein
MLSNLRRRSISGLLVICLFGMLVPFLIAQTAGKGVLTGRITDPSGGAVANASVTATSIDSGQKQTANAGPEDRKSTRLNSSHAQLM